MGGRDNFAQSFTLGENFVISPTTLNSVRFALNRTDIHRTSTDFFSAPEVGVNIYSYLPHYMLLTVTNGFQLGGGTEVESTYATNAWQVSDDVTLVRGSHQFAARGERGALDVPLAGQCALPRPVGGRWRDDRPGVG